MIFKRITCFINKHGVLNPQQYGFQKGISTVHAILNTVTFTYDNTVLIKITLQLFFF